MALKIIAAVADNGVIGKVVEGKHGLPWRLPDDMQWFKDRTMGGTVVSGNTNYKSIPPKYRPLPNRLNIVLTRERYNAISEHENLVYEHDFDSILKRSESEDLWIIGGAEIYQLALPHAMEFYLTRVHGSPEGDVHFPNWDPQDWVLGWEHRREADEKHHFARTWQVYFRNTAIYQFANVRGHTQWKAMMDSLERSECPFCPENIGHTHESAVLWRGKHWMITPNDYPYPNTDSHLLVIPLVHAERLSEIPAEAWYEYAEVLKWIENEFGMKGGGFTMRFGEQLRSGATIKHLHAHVVAPKFSQAVNFYFGCYKITELKPPEISPKS